MQGEARLGNGEDVQNTYRREAAWNQLDTPEVSSNGNMPQRPMGALAGTRGLLDTMRRLWTQARANKAALIEIDRSNSHFARSHLACTDREPDVGFARKSWLLFATRNISSLY